MKDAAVSNQVSPASLLENEERENKTTRHLLLSTYTYPADSMHSNRAQDCKLTKVKKKKGATT